MHVGRHAVVWLRDLKSGLVWTLGLQVCTLCTDVGMQEAQRGLQIFAQHLFVYRKHPPAARVRFPSAAVQPYKLQFCVANRPVDVCFNSNILAHLKGGGRSATNTGFIDTHVLMAHNKQDRATDC